MSKDISNIKSISAMNAQNGSEAILDQPGYIYEPKLDGYRALCFVNGENINFISRNNNNLNSQFPEILDIKDSINAKSCILDGEIVAYNSKGLPDFSLLGSSDAHLVYVVFDILELNSKSLISYPLLERKEILEKVVTPKSNNIEVIFYTANGQALWQEIIKRDLEGVIAKKEESLYYPGTRSKDWLKIKNFKTIDCVILGFSENKRAISSLALGLYKGADLYYVGNVGTGFSEEIIEKLKPILEKLKVLKPQAIIDYSKRQNSYARSLREIQWVKPKLVCEVKYSEFTSYNILRTSVFLRLRTDKNPEECLFP